MNWLRKIGNAIAMRVRWWAGSENRAAAILIVVGFALIVSALAASKAIATGVMAKETQQFDEQVLRRLHEAKDRVLGAHRPAVDELFEDITALGGVTALTLLTIFAATYLALSGRKQEAVLTIVVAVGVFVLNSVLKQYFDRPRPTVFPRPDIFSPSFPSGHAMASMAIYLTHGVLLARLAPTWKARVFATASAVIMALLIAFSRMYLGVHYFTDVVAGALLGLAWALTVLCADEVFRRSRAGREARAPDPEVKTDTTGAVAA